MSQKLCILISGLILRTALKQPHLRRSAKVSELSFQPEDDYVQSANSLFHFMKEADYLKDALGRSALVPRYCVETIDYLGIKSRGKLYDKIAVLQKCFCDLPFHQMGEPFPLTPVQAEKINSAKRSAFSLRRVTPTVRSMESMVWLFRKVGESVTVFNRYIIWTVIRLIPRIIQCTLRTPSLKRPWKHRKSLKLCLNTKTIISPPKLTLITQKDSIHRSNKKLHHVLNHGGVSLVVVLGCQFLIHPHQVGHTAGLGGICTFPKTL